MGIPRFYRWIRNRYPQIRMDLHDKNKHSPIIDNLYFDYNGLIYRCIREFECFLKNKFDPLSFDDIFQKVYEYMMVIVQQVDPQKMIYIAFDGVAPRAKINQSRDRRFKAAKDKQNFKSFMKQIQLEDRENFQENSISPGTDFLVTLCDKMKKRVMNLVQSQWKHLNVLFSDCLVPGQGEHKIMQFLRHSKATNLLQEKQTHCIYSADADVVLLSLAQQTTNIVLIREDSMKQQFGFSAQCFVRNCKEPEFEYVFLNILKEYLSKQFEQCMKSLKLKTVQPIINDFILLMAFVGNDFLPVEFCFSLKQSHMQALFGSYKSYLLETKVFINNNGNIDWKNIKRLLQICRQFEATMLQESIKNKRSNLTNRFSGPRQKKVNNKIEQSQKVVKRQEASKKQDDDDQWQSASNVDEQQVNNFQVQDKKITKGREYYYQKRFDLKDISNDNFQFQQIIKKYIEGLEFYCNYYFKGLPSWSWYYPYHYTPLITDIYEYIAHHQVQVKLVKACPYDPFMALMLMLPPESFGLLPTAIQKQLQSDEQKQFLAEYFPQKFKLDPYESINYSKRVLIKFLEQQTIKKIYSRLDRNQYTNEERVRNVKNNLMLFRNTNDIVSGMEVLFERKQTQKQVHAIFSNKKNQNKNIANRNRFPSLDLFGNYSVSDKGKIQTSHKYRYEGSPSQLVYFNHFIGYIQEVIKCPEDLHSQFEEAYEKFGIVSTGKCENYYKVKQIRLIREVNHYNFVKTNRQVFVPDFALFKMPKYEYLPEKCNFQMKNLYQKGQRVGIIGDKKYFGQIGIIQDCLDSKAVVKFTDRKYRIKQKIQQNQQPFFKLKTVSQELSIHEQVILTILDEVLILPKTSKRFNADIYPMTVNFGLNLISMKSGLICPYYVRCQMEYENTVKKQKIFNHVELSQSCIEILKNYIEKFEFIVDYLERNIANLHDKRGGIKATAIFSENSFITMFKQFLKLYKIQVPGYFFSIYSKVCGYRDLSAEWQLVDKVLENVQIPYSQLISKKQARISSPSLRADPQFHDIGDRVMILKTLQMGYIVGIDDCNLYIKIKGAKKNQEGMNGLMKNIKKVGFLDVFNEKWDNYLMKSEGKSWTMNVSYYSPTHYTSAQ